MNSQERNLVQLEDEINASLRRDELDGMTLTLYDVLPPILPEAGDCKASKYRCETIKPPTELLDDEELFGLRSKFRNEIRLERHDNFAECIIFNVKHFCDNRSYNTLKSLTKFDTRLASMAESTSIRYPLPLQSVCWPQFDDAKWPLLCIGPNKSGKTICYVFYIMCTNIDGTFPIDTAKQTKVFPSSENGTATVDLQQTLKDTEAKRAEEKRNKKRFNYSSDDDSEDDNFDYNKINEKYAKQNNNNNNEDIPGAYNSPEEYQSGETSRLSHNELMCRPKYFIICPTQRDTIYLSRLFEQFTSCANGASGPRVAVISVNDEVDSPIFNGCDVLIATPPLLLHKLDKGCISLTRCQKFIIDDLDKTLQLYNLQVSHIARRLLAYSNRRNGILDKGNESTLNFQWLLFAEKWTNLVKKFTDAVLVQPNIIFASILEAAIYSNMRFEVEKHSSTEEKLTNLENILDVNEKKPDKRIGIVCSDESIAISLNDQLQLNGYNTTFVRESDVRAALIPNKKSWAKSQARQPIYVFTDSSLEQSLNQLNTLNYLIHYDLPTNSRSEFDNRFKIMSQCIKNSAPTTTHILLSSEDAKKAHDLYDIMSRSHNKSHSSNSELRSLKKQYSRQLCWRFAALGVCRLEMLHKNDLNGSSCPYRHAIASPETSLNKATRKDDCTLSYLSSINSSVQLRFIITHVVNPNEFYFRPEAYRTFDDASDQWILLRDQYPIKDMECTLYEYKNSPDGSLSLDTLDREMVYGFYSREEKKVHRVRCIDNDFDWCLALGLYQNNDLKNLPENIKKERCKTIQVRVCHVDYGHKSHVYLKNLFVLPEKLSKARPLAIRGFNLGIKPPLDEPEWPHRSTKLFYDTIVVPNIYHITAWTRLIRENTFWLETIQIKTYMENISQKEKSENLFVTEEPSRKLLDAHLADKNSMTVPCLMRSSSAETLSRWHSIKMKKLATYAHLRTDKNIVSVYLCIFNSLKDIYLRNSDFNKQLVELEDSMHTDLSAGKLKPLKHFEPGTICLGEIKSPEPASSKYWPINRCRIDSLITSNASTNQKRYRLFCLDHGDYVEADENHLFRCQKSHLTRLPLQAIRAGLEGILENACSSSKINYAAIANMAYDLTRTKEDDNYKILKCIVGKKSSEGYKVSLYYPTDREKEYAPLLVGLEQFGLTLEPGLDRSHIIVADNENYGDDELSDNDDLQVAPEDMFLGSLREIVTAIAEEKLSELKKKREREKLRKSPFLRAQKALSGYKK